MFDALGIRAVITGGPLAPTSLLRDLASAVQPTPQFGLTPLEIGDDSRTVLLQAPGLDIALPLPPPQARFIAFSYAVDPASFAAADPKGVTFAVQTVDRTGRREQVWSARHDGRTTLQWVAVPIDTANVGEIRLLTGAPVQGAAARPVWTDLEYLTSATAPTEPALRFLNKVGNTRVYRNTRALPRAWVVHDAIDVRDEAAAIHALRDRSQQDRAGAWAPVAFDPRATAVLEGAPRFGPCGVDAGKDDTATVARYTETRVVLDVRSACAGVLVLSDTFYPGWRATVNGRDARIVPANITMRAVAIPAGASRVVFNYKPRSLMVTIGVDVILVLGFAVAIVYRLARRRRSGATRDAQ
jgi:hypothetical protein